MRKFWQRKSNVVRPEFDFEAQRPDSALSLIVNAMDEVEWEADTSLERKCDNCKHYRLDMAWADGDLQCAYAKCMGDPKKDRSIYITTATLPNNTFTCGVSEFSFTPFDRMVKDYAKRPPEMYIWA